MKEYVLYKGEEILAIGTIPSIAKATGVTKESITKYGKPWYQKKLKGTNIRRLIPLDKEPCFADNEVDCLILKEKDCKECKFYKTIDQLDRLNKELLEIKPLGRCI